MKAILKVTAYCPECNMPLYVINDECGCVSKFCKEYGTIYKLPTVELEASREGIDIFTDKRISDETSDSVN